MQTRLNLSCYAAAPHVPAVYPTVKMHDFQSSTKRHHYWILHQSLLFDFPHNSAVLVGRLVANQIASPCGRFRHVCGRLEVLAPMQETFYMDVVWFLLSLLCCCFHCCSGHQTFSGIRPNCSPQARHESWSHTAQVFPVKIPLTSNIISMIPIITWMRVYITCTTLNETLSYDTVWGIHKSSQWWY